MPCKKGEKLRFCTTCALDVNLLHGGKHDIKVHMASKKPQGHMRATDNQANLTSFVWSVGDFSVIRAEYASS